MYNDPTALFRVMLCNLLSSINLSLRHIRIIARTIVTLHDDGGGEKDTFQTASDGMYNQHNSANSETLDSLEQVNYQNGHRSQAGRTADRRSFSEYPQR